MFSLYFDHIHLCRLVRFAFVKFKPRYSSLFSMPWCGRKRLFSQRSMFPRFLLLCPPAAEDRPFHRGRGLSEPGGGGGGLIEEEQTTNKLHGHYPLCILVLIGVADSCLLIRKGSRKTHKFSQGSQTARSHVRQLRTLP